MVNGFGTTGFLFEKQDPEVSRFLETLYNPDGRTKRLPPSSPPAFSVQRPEWSFLRSLGRTM